jgi:UDP-N-acetylmuramoylalanine--D-glutamate ligase
MKAYSKKTRFGVWGFGVTGRGLTRVLAERGYRVSVVEDRPEGDFADYSAEIGRLKKAGVKFRFGGMKNLGDFLRREADVLAPSPGVHVPEEILGVCSEANIQVSGEMEIASRLIPGTMIAVTGTDGKTTAATLIHHLLVSAGLTSHLAGNVGAPFIELSGKTKPGHWLVIEVSSYQLETVRLFRPHIAVLLNIAEDHLTRHKTMRNYTRIKGRVFERQREEDHAILNFDDPACLQAYGQAHARIHGFSLAGPLRNGGWRQNGDLILDYEGKPVRVIGIDQMKIAGEHNQLNALAAILAGWLAGCPVEAIGGAIADFEGLPHRIEPVGEADGILWVNDSKATNIHSTTSALKYFSRPVVLILGGYDKGLDLTPLIPFIQRHARHVVLMGDTRNRFRKALREAGYMSTTSRKTLPEACAAARTIAQPGDVVLLSPGSSSFDQFKDYVERGEAFRKWVNRKVTGKAK